MQTSDADRAQTARISLHSTAMSKSERTQNKRHAEHLSATTALPPGLSRLRFRAGRRRFRTAFPRPVRFGEAVFTSGCRHPQEEKCSRVTISCQTQENLGFQSLPGAGSPCVRRASGVEFRAPDAASQPNLAPRWVILPPQTVSAIPVSPICSAGIASISPSISTRSAASPGTSRPVMWSMCAAQAPPAVYA